MGAARTRTALYSQTARRRLGDAVARAREAAGYSSTADLARATGRAARAIYALENAEPTVGQSVLQAVGRTLGERLPGWDEDTPRLILEGKPAPAAPSERPDRSGLPDSVSDEEQALVDALIDAEWSAAQIAQAIRRLRRRRDTRPGEPRTETKR
jgi:transcriptional regulator with XRE-family HTH domain